LSRLLNSPSKLQKAIDIVALSCYHLNIVIMLGPRSEGSSMTTYRAYTTIEIAQASGFSMRQLDYWAQCGLLVPSIQQSHGPGTRKLYSVDDLIQLQFIRQLKHNGWSTLKIGKAVKILRTVMNDPDPLKNAVLVHGKGFIVALCKTKEGERIILDALNAGGQQVMGIVLEMLIEEAHQIAECIENPGSSILEEAVQ
jgi:DNA-binding transcriptional MerR regulator